MPLLSTLVVRGDQISIERGRLQILPASGSVPPDEWLQAHSDDLVVEILKLLGLDAYRYESYKTGRYGPSKFAGVTLQFSSVRSGTPAYAIFNVELNRARGARKGFPLPVGQFRVGKRSHFYNFWRVCGLKLPNRLGKFHHHMGNLRSLIFVGVRRGERFQVDSLKPLSIAANVISKGIFADDAGTGLGQNWDKIGTTQRDTDLPPSQTVKGFQQFSTAYLANHGNKVSRECVTRESRYPSDNPVSPRNQSIEEWLAEYE